MAVPAAFDTPLDIRAVFSLLAGFIDSCPDGSNLKITPFPTLTMTSPAGNITAGQTLNLQMDGRGSTANASTTSTTGGGGGSSMFCAFTNQASTQFTEFSSGGCEVPQNLMGITYLSLSSANPASGQLTDDITVAGPVVIAAS